jgi:hypothetical protein
MEQRKYFDQAGTISTHTNINELRNGYAQGTHTSHLKNILAVGTLQLSITMQRQGLLLDVSASR